MPLSTDISLPPEVEPIFPDRCVVCDDATTERANISVETSSFLLGLFVPLLSLFGWKRVAFPICPECKIPFFRQRWARSLVCWTIVAVVVFFALPYFKGVNRALTKWAVLAIGIAAIVPNIAFEVFFPRWFDVTASKKKTDYEFKSEDYATDFFALNRAAYPDIEIRVDDEIV